MLLFTTTPLEYRLHIGIIGKVGIGLARTTDGTRSGAHSSTEFTRGSFCISRVPIQIECMVMTRAPRFSPYFFDFTCCSHFTNSGMQLLVDPTYVYPSPLVML